jgi:1A family penicillin-binding protein
MVGRVYYRKFKKPRKKRLIKAFLRLIVFCFLFLGFLSLGVFAYFAKDLPDPEKINQRQVVESTKIYDRTGQILLYDIHAEEKRTVIPFEEIPQYVKEATIVIEDDNFYHHFGLDWKGIIRAALANLRGKRITQGGSTITQQFIKNAILTPERTFTRKIKEAILALELERKYTKDEILGFYLNQVPYGSNAYGIEAAAQTFFDKSAKDLTLAEAALLAALPKAPTYYSPYGSHADELKARQEYILDRMVKFGYLTQEEAMEAKKQELKYSPQRHGLKAPHFVMYIREYLEEKYGQDYIERGGLKVYTTLDWELQKIAEEVIAERADYNEKHHRATNAALVALDPKTGQILAMVGSRDYFDIENQGNFNVAISPHRQPGSSFKPFAYAVALKKGFTPETILFDLETSFGQYGPKKEEYKPQNYDGKFRGPVTMRQALAQSINLPSVKVLYLAGLNETINLAQDMGITTLKDRKRYNLALVLGGGEVKLLDEVAAYGVFATEGVKHPISSILKVEDSQGNILEEYQDKPIRILDQQTARQINDILSDEEARAPMFGNHSKLYLADRPAAVKTGTTQEYRDGWTVGYTPSLVAGVWVGNNDNSPMRQGAGIYVAAPIWHEFMTRAYQTANSKQRIANDNNKFILPTEAEEFTPPEPVISDKPILNGEFAFAKKVKIDKISGKLATDLTPPELTEEKIYQEVHSILYYVDKNNPQGPIPENPENDPQFLNWETPVLAWAKNPPCSTSTCPIYNQQPPTEYDDIHIPENQPEIKITSPKEGQSISQSILTIKAEAEAPLGIKQLDFFINNQLVGTDTTKPYSITFNLIPYLTTSTQQTIKVRAYDQVLNRQEDEISINFQSLPFFHILFQEDAAAKTDS